MGSPPKGDRIRGVVHPCPEGPAHSAGERDPTPPLEKKIPPDSELHPFTCLEFEGGFRRNSNNLWQRKRRNGKTFVESLYVPVNRKISFKKWNHPWIHHLSPWSSSGAEELRLHGTGISSGWKKFFFGGRGGCCLRAGEQAPFVCLCACCGYVCVCVCPEFCKLGEIKPDCLHCAVRETINFYRWVQLGPFPAPSCWSKLFKQSCCGGFSSGESNGSGLSNLILCRGQSNTIPALHPMTNFCLTLPRSHVR